MELYGERVEWARIGGPNFDARQAMNAIDEIIGDIYLPFRGQEGYKTERAILVEEPHVPHRENDAEHSWSIAFAAMVLHDMREKFGLEFPTDFNLDLAVNQGLIHDIIEIKSDDVDAMTRDPNEIALKPMRERAALLQFLADHPNLTGIMRRWQEYEDRESPESWFISDLDKIVATRLIFLDGGRKWHGWEGYKTARHEMSERIRGKLRTDMGHQLMDTIEADIDANPHVFPYHESQNDCHHQLSFDLESAIMEL